MASSSHRGVGAVSAAVGAGVGVGAVGVVSVGGNNKKQTNENVEPAPLDTPATSLVPSSPLTFSAASVRATSTPAAYVRPTNFQSARSPKLKGPLGPLASLFESEAPTPQPPETQAVAATLMGPTGQHRQRCHVFGGHLVLL